MIVCVIFYHLGLGHPTVEAIAHTHRQTHRQRDIATSRLRLPRGQISEKYAVYKIGPANLSLLIITIVKYPPVK